MKNKNVFTLVKLLAVIVVLAIILVIAVPQVLDVVNSSKVNSLKVAAIQIANEAEKKYADRYIEGATLTTIQCSEIRELNNEDYGTCTVKYDEDGIATVKLKGKKDGKFNNLKCEGTRNNMICGDIPPLPVINCTFDGELVQGAEYVNGQYTYRYKQYYGGRNWYSISEDGWGVTLTDKESTAPVTSEVCTYINDKPLVSMRYMFYQSQAESIDFSSFNTSNVINMYGMFDRSAAKSLDLSNFDTSKVTNMSGMFYYNAATSLDLSSFDTENVTDMEFMFDSSAATSLDLSSFDTSKLTNMSSMFENSAAKSLDLNSFDTSKVTNMGGMFAGSEATSLDLSSFDTNNVTNMRQMFYSSDATSLDLSSFDTSKVTDMSEMFAYSAVRTGYARTQADADKFNSSSNKPSALTFVVKGS